MKMNLMTHNDAGPRVTRGALARTVSVAALLMAAIGAHAQVVCNPSAAPTPAIANQNVTLLGNCTVAGAPAPATSTEVWSVPLAAGTTTTLNRPLAAPPLTVSFAAAGAQALSVRLLTNGVLSAPFALTLDVGAPNGAVASRVNQVAAPQQAAAQSSVRTQLSTVTNRLRYLRTQSGTPLLSGSVSTSTGTVSTSSTDTGSGNKGSTESDSGGRSANEEGANADATRTGRLGVFIAGGLEDGRQTATADSPAFRTRTTGATFGADYRLTPQFVVGAGLGLLETSTRFAVGTGRQYTKGQSGTVYTSWSPTPSLYFDAAYAVDRSRYEVKRDDLVNDAAYGRTNGKGSGVTLTANYDQRFGAWTLSPYARFEQVDVRIQAFDEFGSANSLQLGEQRVKAGTATVGVHAQYNLSTSFGIVTPHLRVEMTRLTDEQQDPVRARLLNSSAVLFVDSAAGRADRNYGSVALGVSAQMRRGVTMFIDLESGFGQVNYRLTRVNSGVKLEL
jgi:large repetitive protein